jgi:hypothetical protein
MTIQQHASFDSSAAELNATSKLVKAWESKNAKNAARAGGVSLMALSLAACGGSSDTNSSNAGADAGADQVDDVDTGTDEGVIETPVNTGAMRLTIGDDTPDTLPGTDAADAFEAKLTSTVFGSVANTLSSADEINGGGDVDTLDAQIISEFIGFDADDGIDIQPTISDVEVIRFEARDTGNVNLDVITVDAKDITGHESVGSFRSDGDLIIENMNTIDDDGDIRLTSDITITMGYTDSYNSDGDASDLLVLFDEDYLNTSKDESGSTLTVQVVNAVTNVVNGNPIAGTSAFTVNVDGTAVVVDVSAIAADDTLTFATAYDAVAEAVNDAMAAAGFDTVTATTAALTPAVFSIGVDANDTSYSAGDSAGSFHPIVLTNSGAEALTAGTFTQAQTEDATDINSGMNATAPGTLEVPISINVELEKVGRDGEGGDLVIGAKDMNLNGDTDVDQNDGIEVFNITVNGDADRPSNLGVIASTEDTLTTVNIATGTGGSAGDYAALTVRGEAGYESASEISSLITGGEALNPFDGNLERLDADEFMGALRIGEEAHAFDIETFTATGGGDVYLNQVLGATNDTDAAGNDDEADDDGLVSTGNLARSVTTGSGDDELILDVNGGAQVTVNTGAGDDSITAGIDGDTNSGSTRSFLDVSSASGDNTVVLSTFLGSETADGGVNAADVDLGTGADTVTGGSVELTVDTNGGNDVIYADNTGGAAIAGALAGDSTSDLTEADIGANNTDLLFNQTMTITVDMPDAIESDVAEAFVNGYEITASVNTDGFISTELEVYQSIRDAINGDEVLNKLVAAEIDSLGNLTVEYLIDGIGNNSSGVAVEVLFNGEYADLSTNEAASLLAAVREEFGDSAITAAELETAYDQAAAVDLAIDYTDNGTVSDLGGGNNVVNGGAGDDVIVLSSNIGDFGDTTDDGTDDVIGIFDTLVMDAGDFGNDVVVHFDAEHNSDAGLGDMLDFAFLDTLSSASGSDETAVRIDGTVAAAGDIIENSVVVEDMDSMGTLNFDTMTEAQVLAHLNDSADWGVDAASFDGNRVGDDVKAIIMIEDELNDIETDDNDGFYKVFEVTYDAEEGEFTSVNLAGTLDFADDANMDILADLNVI